jgi:hypothetical protein
VQLAVEVGVVPDAQLGVLRQPLGPLHQPVADLGWLVEQVGACRTEVEAEAAAEAEGEAAEEAAEEAVVVVG